MQSSPSTFEISESGIVSTTNSSNARCEKKDLLKFPFSKMITPAEKCNSLRSIEKDWLTNADKSEEGKKKKDQKSTDVW